MVLFWFFCFLALLIFGKLVLMQVVDGGYRQEQLLTQHYTRSELKAKRGQIFVMDKSQNAIQLTDNIDYFTLFVDPKFVPDKPELIRILSPILYEHFCVTFGVETITKQKCMENLESFTRQDLIPDEFGQFVNTGEYLYYVTSGDYAAEIAPIIDEFTQERGESMIQQRLDQMIQQGIRELNYIGLSEDSELIQAVSVLPYVVIEGQFMYLRPDAVIDKDREAQRLFEILDAYEFEITLDALRTLVRPQENRYVKIADGINAKLADKLLKEKATATENFAAMERAQRAAQQVALLHGVGLESYQKRYYPHERFASHLIGYVNPDGDGTYGIEEYYDEILAWRDGKVIGLATPWIGEVGANNFEIEQPVDGQDIYLSIDPIIQKEVELIAQQFLESLYADSIAVTVLDPRTGKVRAMVNAPDFNPNNVGEIYKLLPIGLEQQTWLVESPTYMDIPLLYLSGDNIVQATFDERKLPGVKKYYFENLLWPQTFVNKNISMSYEPGSIMKWVTLGIWVDTDTVGLYDYYYDPGRVQVGEFTISNVSKSCIGEHTYLHALEFSCNVGMIRLAQKLSKYLFYNYMDRLGFGKLSGIELAGEDAGRIPDFNNVPLSQFFNNTYGQGMLATPLQMAVSYAALINGGIVYKPSIVQAMRSPWGELREVPPRVVEKVFKDTTSLSMRTALESVLSNGGSVKLHKPGYALGGKTGTAQIAFRWTYQDGAGWTNGSVMGIVSSENPTYVIAIQVKRPRSSPWAEETAGKIFTRVTDFLLNYERLEK
jgi:stage V sporulation protein D (sporulation-specific penicillin-binding protein)